MHYSMIRATHRRRVVARFKRMKGCTDCGYKTHPAALEFDHVDEASKRDTVASLMYASWSVIKLEISKCVIRCANCHAIRTVERKYRKNNAPMVEWQTRTA